jgi:hypothetical protein
MMRGARVRQSSIEIHRVIGLTSITFNLGIEEFRNLGIEELMNIKPENMKAWHPNS